MRVANSIVENAIESNVMKTVKKSSTEAVPVANTLLHTDVALVRRFTAEGTCYFELTIGTDPETSFSVSDVNLQSLLEDLPNILSTVIQSQVLIESA